GLMAKPPTAPPRTELGSRIPIPVLTRSATPGRVIGTLTLKQHSKDADGTPQSINVPPSPLPVSVGPGLNTFRFPQPALAGEQRSYTYQAIRQPEGAEAGAGKMLAGQPACGPQ